MSGRAATFLSHFTGLPKSYTRCGNRWSPSRGHPYKYTLRHTTTHTLPTSCLVISPKDGTRVAQCFPYYSAITFATSGTALTVEGGSQRAKQTQGRYSGTYCLLGLARSRLILVLKRGLGSGAVGRQPERGQRERLTKSRTGPVLLTPCFCPRPWVRVAVGVEAKPPRVTSTPPTPGKISS